MYCTSTDKQTKQRTRAPHQKYIFLKSTPNIWVYFVFFHRALFRHLWWPRAARAKGSGQSNLPPKLCVVLGVSDHDQISTMHGKKPSPDDRTVSGNMLGGRPSAEHIAQFPFHSIALTAGSSRDTMLNCRSKTRTQTEVTKTYVTPL